MAAAVFENVKITGLACAVPVCINRVDSFIDLFGKESVEKFTTTTGIRERRFVPDYQTGSDLCFVAAERLIAHKGYETASIDGVIFVTQTPDYARPATAYILHKRLGLSQDCMAMDISLGCSGFIYGLNAAAAMICSGALQRVLLCCGESHTCLDPADDKAISMLFGDAGSAVIVEAGNDTIHTLLKADGEGYQAILAPGLNARVKVDMAHLEYDRIREKMDGSTVFEFAIRQIPKAFKEFFKLFGGGRLTIMIIVCFIRRICLFWNIFEKSSGLRKRKCPFQ